MKKIKYPLLLWFGIVLFCIAADQLSKLAVIKTMTLYESFPVIKGLLNFTYTTNSGAAWGLFSEQRWIFMSLSLLAIVALPFAIWYFRRLHLLFGISVSLITGGAIGNMIDRFFRVEVVDFLEFAFFKFPVFNIADCCITCGAAVFVVYLLFFDKYFFPKTEKTPKASESKEGDGNEHK